ncbi:integral membrane sensor signal transduction histidine kinase [Actinobacteria bacterium OK074]|nr:integral membrane sensor signal transduction histidine kinase [Actinobacteria bacterium OK074]
MWTTVRQSARATAQLARTGALAFGTYLFVTVLLITAIATAAVAGAGMLPETTLLIRRIAGAKRRQVGAWTGRPVPEAYLTIEGTLKERLRTAVLGPGLLTDLRWMVAHYGYGAVLPLLALPLWPVGLVIDGVRVGLLRRKPVVLPLITSLADLDARWSTALLKPSPQAQLAARVEELTETRAGAVAAHGAELRRIERDLHDGTQARLVSLSMRIGLAKRAYDRDPEAARRMLKEAQELAEEALTDLRHVVRGIHPPILTDRGLVGAVRALAAGSGLETAVHADEILEHGSRAPAAVEAAAYFVVAEALTNAAKHSGAARAWVDLERTPRGLRVLIGDEGIGGAEEITLVTGLEVGGSGLLGMRRRVAALDGTLTVTSPVGGPTMVAADLPCVW